MTKINHGEDISDHSNAEYVILRTSSMDIWEKSNTRKIDNLAILLEESDSVTNFRRYLDSINSGHFLDFWFACQGFRNFDKSDSHKLNQLTKVIYRAYIRSESPFAVPLKSNTKKSIVDKLSDRKSFDPSIFDTAQSEIRDILAGEFLMKFYNSEFYSEIYFEKGSFNSATNIPQLLQTISDVPMSSSSSTGYISRRFLGGATSRHLATSRSSDAVIDSTVNRSVPDNSTTLAYTTAQNTGTVTSGFNNNSFFGVNPGSSSSKDRRNLSETDPTAFAVILAKRLDELFVEQSKFDRILRLVKSVPNESDTDDSHASAISYLMKCQLYNPNPSSLDGDGSRDTEALLSSVSHRIKSSYCTGDEVKDEYAQGILESHCSRIGVDQNQSRSAITRRDCSENRRDNSESRTKWKRDTADLGSTTSYDSGVATSLEQYSNFGVPGHLFNTIFQMHRASSKNIDSVDLAMDSHRYHHHHHHHHHKNNHSDYPFQKGTATNLDFPALNRLSDGSSNFDSGVSSTYDHLGRRFQTKDDKVANWMNKNPKLTSKTCYDFNNSCLPKLTSGIPPNTPLISARGISENCPPQSQYLQSRCYPNKSFSPLPETGILPCQSIENWLQQQENCAAILANCDPRSQDYCSSTVGVAGSELLLRDHVGRRDQRSSQPMAVKEPQNCHQSSKPRLTGPLVVGYYIGNDPVPYRTQIPDTQQITLGQFKALIAKKGPFRYFFKRYCDEFECGVVHEEISKDDAILPLWEGKVVAKIEKSD